MDNPSVLPGIPVDHIEREHREHKLSLDGFEQLQELLHILLVECILIVSAIGVHIRRIDEMKGIIDSQKKTEAEHKRKITEKENLLAAKDNLLADKDKEIAKLKALLAASKK